MTVESDDDLQKLKSIGRIVALILKEMMHKTEPGMTTLELDLIGKDLFEKYGAQSAPILTYDFPGYTCISVNEQAAHGVPGDRIIRPGDMVNIDVSAEKDGYFADTGGSFVVPPSSALKDKLCHATRMALEYAANEAQAGLPLNRIGKAIEKVAKHNRFKIIKNLCSHGVGRSLHEEPKQITGYYERRDLRILQKGQVITIEPFLSTKSKIVKEQSDGWTLSGVSGNLSAQYEHTMIITNNKPILLTIA